MNLHHVIKKGFTQAAFSVFQQSVGEEPIPDTAPSPYAKRGDAKARALTAEQRKEIATNAAKAH